MMDADQPLASREKDRLGFAPIAEQLAKAIAGQRSPSGFVFGIEGRWGAGKTTLINLTIEALRTLGSIAPEIVTFSPWLVGDREELLASLFDELASAAIKIDPTEEQNAVPTSKKSRFSAVFDKSARLSEKEKFRNSLGPKLRAFGSFASTLGKFTRTAEALGLPLAGFASMALERTGDLAKDITSVVPASKRKAELVNELKRLSRGIVVFIDDIDRLEPKEVSEVLRLVRAVADFPNITYVLSYDPKIIADTVSRALQVDDGEAFLEKIVQVSFRVPRPEAFDLRRWLQIELHKLFPALTEPSFNPEVSERLRQVVDQQGGRYIETGRDVSRAINALQLHARPIIERIDIADMVWLQLIKVGNPQFYTWIEEYLTELAALAGAPGVSISTEARVGMEQRLDAIFAAENLDPDLAYISLSDMLPGVEAHSMDKPRLFHNISVTSLAPFIVSKRLGSPEHYRLYFAFSEPAGALRDEQVELFIETAKVSADAASELFGRFSREKRPQGGTLAELLMDRLIVSIDRLSDGAAPAVIFALAEWMDSDSLAVAGDFGERFSWRLATRLLEVLLRKAEPETRRPTIDRLFREGKALGWLSSVLRDEIFSHGIFGDRARPESHWLLDAAEFNDVVQIMNDRYSQLNSETLKAVPDLLNLLFAWAQSGHPIEARAWVQAQISTTAGLLAFLQKTKSWSNRNGKTHYPLRRSNLDQFLDFDATIRRLEDISLKSDPKDQAVAKELLATVDDRDI